MRAIDQTNLRILIVAFYIAVFSFAIYYAVQYLVGKFFASFALYVPYVYDLAVVLTLVFFGYAIIRIFSAWVERYAYRRTESKIGANIVKLVVQLILYVCLILVILSFLGVSLSSLVVGGAIGGVALGLALQTMAPIVLSGFLISSSRALAPGSIFILKSYVWGDGPKLCKIRRTGFVFTEVYNSDGQILKFPNTMLMNSTVSTNLEFEGEYKHSVDVNVKNDVQIEHFDKYFRSEIDKMFKRLGDHKPDPMLASTTDKTFVYGVDYYFKDMSDVASTVDGIFKCSDKAYWMAKKKNR